MYMLTCTSLVGEKLIFIVELLPLPTSAPTIGTATLNYATAGRSIGSKTTKSST